MKMKAKKGWKDGKPVGNDDNDDPSSTTEAVAQSRAEAAAPKTHVRVFDRCSNEKKRVLIFIKF